MSKLHISSDLSLPKEAVTQTFVVYGGKGMGKTNFGSVFAEELSAARLRFSIIDPMGVWWGLRHSADGKSPGIELLILGGVKGDMPIEPTAGAIVADLVADESVNVLIDISRFANGKMWTRGERIRFVRDYFVRLYERQGEDRRPLMQIVDEAARFAPQLARHGEEDVAQCLGAIASMVEEGRNVGVGVCLLTQRSARLNKDVAELADCMIAFRIVGPRSIDAVLDWFGEHIEKARWKELIDKLRKLPIGRALVVSPGWLEFEDEALIRKRETFDSSATPKPGEKARTPHGAAARPDLAKYQERMAATIEQAKANDPKELKKKIVALERELAKKQPVEKIRTESKRVEVPVLKDGQITRLEKLAARLEKLFFGFSDHFSKPFGNLTAQIGALLSATKAVAAIGIPARAAFPPNLPDRDRSPLLTRQATPRPNRTVRDSSTVARNDNDGSSLGIGERRCAIAIAQHPNGVMREQLTTLTGYKRSTRNTYLQRMLAAGLVTQSGERFVITDAGVDWIGSDYQPLPTGAELQRYWIDKLPAGESAVFAVVLHNPDGITREDIGQLTNFKRSTRNTYLQRLAARELVTISGDVVRPSETLFEAT